MIKLKSLLDNQWFFPLLMLYYGIYYFLFGESYPYNSGFSPDGFVYASFIPDIKNSFFFDVYYVQRILPSLIVSLFFKLLSISSTPPHIHSAFQILNIASMVISCFFFKQILQLLKITFKNQMLAFALLLLNFGVIKYPYYLPVMMDTFALTLSTALLYFYLKNNIIGIVISTLFLAFTWPMGYYQGLLLIAFPICILPFTPTLKWQKTLIYGACIFLILALSFYLVFIKKLDNTVDFVLRIDRNLLPLSILGLAIVYFFFAKLFLNKTLFDIKLFFKKINYKRILISIGVFALVSIIIRILNPSQNSMYPIIQIPQNVIISALIKPLFSFVADTSYWGIIVCLLLLFWNSFCKTVSQMGWGIVGAFGLNLFLFGIVPETRCLTNLLPWLIVFLILTLNKFSFSNRFYIVAGLLSFIASKIWLLLNLYDLNSTINLDKNGSIGFPGQILWMNIGPWMSEQMYYVQGAAMMIFTGILFLMLYKVKLTDLNKIKLVKRY